MSYWEGKRRTGYTLLELLISISIMALLTIIFIPDIDRTLSKNNIASDAELISSEIESTRLLAGSTQQYDAASNNSEYGFYAAVFPGSDKSQFYIARIDADSSGDFSTNGSCPASSVLTTNPPSNCVVSTVMLSSGDEFTNQPSWAIFEAPTQQLVSYNGQGVPAVYPASNTSVYLSLSPFGKTATLTIDGVTGKVTTNYN